MTKWISVNEKLPNIKESVLVIGVEEPNFTTMYVAWIEKITKRGIAWVYSDCCGCYCQSEITHWMPLPDLPHKEQRKQHELDYLRTLEGK